MLSALRFTTFKSGLMSSLRAFSSYTPADGLVDPEWLQQRLGKVRVIDATLHLDPKRNAVKEYTDKRIPGAQFFNIDTVADCQLNLPHMLPTPTFFKQCIEDMGINDDEEIVIYDTHGLFSATRAWWMFSLFNSKAKVYVLNGGLPRWEAEKRPLEGGEVAPISEKGHFYVNPDYSIVRVLDQVKDLVSDFQAGKTDLTVVDARPKGRFDGSVPEPRPGLKNGHMPGSKNIPFNAITNPEKQFEMRPREELLQIFKNAGVDLDRKETIVFSCGSGTTACVDLFAAHLLNRKTPGSCAVYDGSWAEYASKPETPNEFTKE